MTPVAQPKQRNPRGRPPVPLPPVYWKLRVDFEPPDLCLKHPALAKLLRWQIVFVHPGKTGADDGDESNQVVSIPSYIETDDGEKHRWLRSFASADKPLHGWVFLRREPPPDTIAVVRIRGLEGDPVGNVSLAKAEKVDQQLRSTPAAEIARAAVSNPEVLALIAEHLKVPESGTGTRNKKK